MIHCGDVVVHRDQSCPATPSPSYLIFMIVMPRLASTSPLHDSSLPPRPVTLQAVLPYTQPHNTTTAQLSTTPSSTTLHYFRNGSHLRAHGCARPLRHHLGPQPNTPTTLHRPSLLARELRAQPVPQPRDLRPHQLQERQRTPRSRRLHRQLCQSSESECGAAGTESPGYLCEELWIPVSIAGGDQGVFE